METAIDRDGKENEPAWSIERNSLGLRVTPRSFFLRSDGRMTGGRPAATRAATATATRCRRPT